MSKFNFSKKGALDLGITTVVVLVIAMVVIGAGISFIRTFFDLGTESLTGAFPTDDTWGNLADRNTPLVLARTVVDIGQAEGSTTDIEVRFYNTHSGNVDVTLNETLTCTGDGNLSLTALRATSIPPSSMTSIPAILHNSGSSNDGLGQGTHICELVAHIGDERVLTLQARVNVLN